LRFFLGAVESAFFPLVIFYLTTFYRRSELARRLAIFYAASNIANAFSGLLAFGVFQIKSHLVDHPWRWLFIIEGSLTVLFSIFVFFNLPKSAAEATFLNEEEKALAYHRIHVDSSSVVNESFNLRESLQVFKRPSTYGFLLIEIARTYRYSWISSALLLYFGLSFYITFISPIRAPQPAVEYS
jgi:MFS family permease